MINFWNNFFYKILKYWYSGLHVILLGFIGLIFYSCSSLKSIGIQVSVLPGYPISEDIKSLALLNRSMTDRFTNSKADSLEKILVKNKMLMDSVFQDSLASDTTIQVAARALFESGRFDVVVPKERNIFRNENDELPTTLNSRFIDDICKDFNVDAVLVLESFSEHLNTKYFMMLGVGSIIEEYYAATDIDYKSEWRLYRPGNLKPAIRFAVSDSIFWKANSISLDDLFSQMPRTKEALAGGGIASGLKIADLISPGWVNQNRYYFITGNKEIDEAVPLIKNNRWEEANALWSKFVSVNSIKIRSKVEYNLALAAEMNGDIDLAIEWGLKSFKTRYSKAIEVYLKMLDDKRKAQLKDNKVRY